MWRERMRHLVVRLEAPLMAFGGETIDNYGVVRWFPSASMLTGLLANALGWRRIERQRHQRLQDRLIFAARIDREPAGGMHLQDYQTALLYEDDAGWTTRGHPEGRNKSPSYQPIKPDDRRALTWQRYRHYWADMHVTVALRLQPDGEGPTLDDLQVALESPARPVFIGRKTCLPSDRIFGGFRVGDTVLSALVDVPVESSETGRAVRLLWPRGEGIGSVESTKTYMVTDERNWISGLHGGGRAVCEGTMPVESFAANGERQAEAQS